MLHNIYSLLLVVACILVFLSLQFVSFLLLFRYLRASVYSEFSAFFTPSKAGEKSEFGKITEGMAVAMADTLFNKIKMSAIGQAGGVAERHPKIASGGNGLMDMLLNRFLGGAMQGVLPGIPSGENNNNNHSGSDYGQELAKFK